MTQCNVMDLSRTSASYEQRLYKYSQRGFEIYYDDLDRGKINSKIFSQKRNGMMETNGS